MHKKSILSIREKERNLPCISLLQYIIAPFGTYAPKKGETSGRGFCPNCFEVHQKFFFLLTNKLHFKNGFTSFITTADS